MSKYFRIIIYIVLLFCTTGCGGGGSGGSGGQSAKTYTLTGQVGTYVGKFKNCDTCSYWEVTYPTYRLSDITVSCDGKTTTSGNGGYFTISGLAEDIHSISFFNSTYLDPTTQTYSVLILGDTTQGFYVTLKNSYIGRLYISSNVYGASIFMDSYQMMYGSSADNPVTTNVLLEDFPVGSFSVYLTKSGYQQSETKTAVIQAGQQTNLDFTLTPVP